MHAYIGKIFKKWYQYCNLKTIIASVLIFCKPNETKLYRLFHYDKTDNSYTAKHTAQKGYRIITSYEYVMVG